MQNKLVFFGVCVRAIAHARIINWINFTGFFSLLLWSIFCMTIYPCDSNVILNFFSLFLQQQQQQKISNTSWKQLVQISNEIVMWKQFNHFDITMCARIKDGNVHFDWNAPHKFRIISIHLLFNCNSNNRIKKQPEDWINNIIKWKDLFFFFILLFFAYKRFV